jgi:hypothetical protein
MGATLRRQGEIKGRNSVMARLSPRSFRHSGELQRGASAPLCRFPGTPSVAASVPHAHNKTTKKKQRIIFLKKIILLFNLTHLGGDKGVRPIATSLPFS